MDLYSRYIMAWMISKKENTALAQQLMREAYDVPKGIEDACRRQANEAP